MNRNEKRNIKIRDNIIRVEDRINNNNETANDDTLKNVHKIKYYKIHISTHTQKASQAISIYHTNV